MYQRRNKNWDYYSMKSCKRGNMILSAIEVLSGPFYYLFIFVKLKLYIKFNIGTECGSEKAYHSGSMFKDYSSPEVTDASQCLDKCNSDSSCKFWDYGEGWCRLRSDSGQGEEKANGYSFGAKNCIFESSSKTRKN